MALTLVVENGTGLANANAFDTVSNVTTRVEAFPWATAWGDADLTQQTQFVLEATAIIGRLPWDGVASFLTQALPFPRAWLSTPDGNAIASNSIPAWLLDGHARLAAWLATQAATPYTDTGLAPGTRVELPGGLKVTPAARTNVLPPDVRAIFRPYLRGSGTIVRG